MKTDDKNNNPILLSTTTFQGQESFEIEFNCYNDSLIISEAVDSIMIGISDCGSQCSIAISKADFLVIVEKLMFIYPRLSKP